MKNIVKQLKHQKILGIHQRHTEISIKRRSKECLKKKSSPDVTNKAEEIMESGNRKTKKGRSRNTTWKAPRSKRGFRGNKRTARRDN